MRPKALLELLAMPLSVAKPMSPVPMLQFLHIDGGRVTATNGDVTIRVDVADTGVLDGISGCVSAPRLQIALGTLGDLDAKLRAVDGALTIVAGRGRRTLPLLPVSDFPLPADDQCELADVPDAAALAAAIEFVRPSVSMAEARPQFRGLMTRAGDLGGTDGARVHIAAGAAKASCIPDMLSLPLAPALTLQKLAAEAAKEPAAGPLRIGKAGAKDGLPVGLHVHWSRWAMRFPLLNTVPPDFQRASPADHAPLRLTVVRRDLAAACRAAVRLTESKQLAAVTINITPGQGDEQGSLQITLQAAISGEDMVEEVACTASRAWSIGINAELVADALDSLNGDIVTLSSADEKTASVLITGAADGRRCTVARMRI